MDVPRLSTLQALLLMLKAREAVPKRGYYYRSWMSIVQCVQMGKDLGLDEHYADHKAGRPCESSPAECLLKTRIWQTVFICEVMIGTPQGRTELSVHEDTVDSREPHPAPGVADSDMKVSRNFVYLVRVVSNISRMNRIYSRIKRNKDWAVDPDFTRMTPLLHAWPNELPADLSVTFSQDGSPPWLPSAFIGNMHCYYYLSILLLHRPQLQLLTPSSPDGRWKHHMMVCYSSAKLICRLEEAILQGFGLSALQNMQRGINFTIYSVLTCILVHLVTSHPFLLTLSLHLHLSCFSVQLPTSIDCFDVSGPGFQYGRARVLYAAHADTGEVHECLADGGYAAANRRDSRGILGRCPQAVCSKADVPVRQSVAYFEPRHAATPAGQQQFWSNAQSNEFPTRHATCTVHGTVHGRDDATAAAAAAAAAATTSPTATCFEPVAGAHLGDVYRAPHLAAGLCRNIRHKELRLATLRAVSEHDVCGARCPAIERAAKRHDSQRCNGLEPIQDF